MPRCVRHGIEAIDIERQFHAPLAAELVHQHPAARVSFSVFKQQCRAAWGTFRSGTYAAWPAPLRYPVGNFGDLQKRVHGLVDVLYSPALSRALIGPLTSSYVNVVSTPRIPGPPHSRLSVGREIRAGWTGFGEIRFLKGTGFTGCR